MEFPWENKQRRRKVVKSEEARGSEAQTAEAFEAQRALARIRFLGTEGN